MNNDLIERLKADFAEFEKHHGKPTMPKLMGNYFIPSRVDQIIDHSSMYWGYAYCLISKEDMREAIAALSSVLPDEVNNALEFLEEQAKEFAPPGQLTPEGQEQIAAWLYRCRNLIERLAREHKQLRIDKHELQQRIEELEEETKDYNGLLTYIDSLKAQIAEYDLALGALAKGGHRYAAKKLKRIRGMK